MQTLLLAQTEELNAIDHMVTRLTDAGTLGIAIIIGLVALVGVLAIAFQQRNFGRQQSTTANQNQKLTDTFAGLLTNISSRLEEAQDNKQVLTTVLDNQTIIMQSQDAQANALLKISEIPAVLDDLLKILQDTMTGFREASSGQTQHIAKVQQLSETGFKNLEGRLVRVDMENGKILAALQELKETITELVTEVRRSNDLHAQASAADLKERRKLNEELTALVSKAIARTGVHPAVMIDQDSEEKSS